MSSALKAFRTSGPSQASPGRTGRRARPAGRSSAASRVDGTAPPRRGPGSAAAPRARRRRCPSGTSTVADAPWPPTRPSMQPARPRRHRSRRGRPPRPRCRAARRPGSARGRGCRGRAGGPGSTRARSARRAARRSPGIRPGGQRGQLLDLEAIRDRAGRIHDRRHARRGQVGDRRCAPGAAGCRCCGGAQAASAPTEPKTTLTVPPPLSRASMTLISTCSSSLTADASAAFASSPCSGGTGSSSVPDIRVR